MNYETEPIMILCSSHRARKKFFRLFSARPYWWSMYRDTGKGVYQVSVDELSTALTITGCRKIKFCDKLYQGTL